MKTFTELSGVDPVIFRLPGNVILFVMPFFYYEMFHSTSQPHYISRSVAGIKSKNHVS